MEYKIEVIMTPHPWDNHKKPYFWMIGSYCGNSWCNNGAGWAETPEEAWKQAYEYYNQFYLTKN